MFIFVATLNTLFIFSQIEKVPKYRPPDTRILNTIIRKFDIKSGGSAVIKLY